MAKTRTGGTTRVKSLAGWVFLVATGVLYAAIGLVAPALASKAAGALVPLLLRVLPVLVLVFVLLFLANLLVDRRWLAGYLGHHAGVRGWALAIVCGVLSAGPLYAWFPLLGELRDKGMSRALIAAFLYSRALKLPLLPLMVHYFGTAYTIAVSLGIVLFAVLCGLVTERAVSDGLPEPKED